MNANLCEEIGIRTVFVGGPFFNTINASTGEMEATDKKRITLLLDYFDGADCTVFNAHRREQWGSAFLTAPECTALDFKEIARSDLFIAFPGSPASPGTHVEIGWATAMQKPTVLLLQQNAKYTFLVTGLPALANIELVTYTGDFGFMDGIEEAMRSVMTRHRALDTPA